jgi:glycosyl transferase family 2
MEAASRVTVPPRVVLGMPAYAIADDAAGGDVQSIVESYAREYPQVAYTVNRTRLGMVGNWRRVFELGRASFPDSECFAWVSDHDVWHARWLETLVSVLDREPRVVIAYSESLRMTPDDAWHEKKGFQTVGVSRASVRIAHSALHMLAGDMIYGLMRTRALERAGVFRHVLTPDRQLLLALSLLGEARQVPQVLWYREMTREFDLKRQRRVFFPNGTPLYAYLPSHLQHFATLLWDFGVRGKGRPAFGRVAGASYAAMQLWFSLARQLPRLRTGARRS